MKTLIYISLLVITITAQTTSPRLPNIDFLQKGYNIYKGNPFAGSPLPDPGFTQNTIWNFSYTPDRTTADGRYSIPDGTSFLITDSCQLDFESSSMSGETTYTRNLQQLVTADAGYMDGSFSASVGYNSMKTEFNSYDLRYTVSTATCFVYQASIDGQPRFSSTFLNDAAQLPVSFDLQAYQKFYDKYGTHYIGVMDMGATLTYIDSFTASNWSKLESEGIDVSVAAKYSGLVSVGVTSSTQVNTAVASAYNSQLTKRRTISSGSRPPADGNVGTWLSTSVNNPAPIGLTLKSLSELFTQSYFDASFANYKDLATIKTNLDQAFESYCRHLQSITTTQNLKPSCLPPNSDKIFGLVGTYISLTPYNQDTYLRHKTNQTLLSFELNDSTDQFKNDATWLIVSGLCGIDGTISFQSLTNPMYYIRQDHADQDPGTTSGRKEMCYYLRTGWVDDSGYSFESVSKPGYYLDGSSATLGLVNRTTNATFDAAATFSAAQNPLILPVLGKYYSIESIVSPGNYLRHASFVVSIWNFENNNLYKLDSTFKAVKGLCGVKGSFSFQPINFPGSYIRHHDYKLVIAASDGSDLFKNDACFIIRPPLSGNIGVSLESVNYPGYFVKIPDSQAGGMTISQYQGLASFQQLATLLITAPNAA